MRTADFDYKLPLELIAQVPAPQRDQSRLLVLHRPSGQVSHRLFGDLLQYLRAGDLLVLNNSRVIPARLRGKKAGSGGQFEVLLIEENQPNDWWVMLKPAKRVRPGTLLRFDTASGQPANLEATVLEKNPEGHCRLLFSANENVLDKLDKLGQAPLPPYIARLPNAGGVNDTERYQTVYAEIPGSVAAPTAGLHFTQSLLAQIRAAGVHVCFITLHVGLGTFAPVKTSSLAAHPMHAEHFAVKDDAASMVNDAKRAGGRIVAVGTTTVRVLEAVAQQNQGKMAPASGRTNLFIYPPFQFQVVDVLLTNFHLPKSTLLMLVCAFASPNTTRGRDTVMAAYGEAIRQQYRFYSYGDAMLID